MIAPSIDPRRQDAALRPQPSRDGADYWPTPASLIGALIPHVLPTLPAGPVWECAAGDGRLAAAMRDARRHDWRARWLADSTRAGRSRGFYGELVTTARR